MKPGEWRECRSRYQRFETRVEGFAMFNNTTVRTIVLAVAVSAALSGCTAPQPKPLTLLGEVYTSQDGSERYVRLRPGAGLPSRTVGSDQQSNMASHRTAVLPGGREQEQSRRVEAQKPAQNVAVASVASRSRTATPSAPAPASVRPEITPAKPNPPATVAAEPHATPEVPVKQKSPQQPTRCFYEAVPTTGAASGDGTALFVRCSDGQKDHWIIPELSETAETS